MQCIKNGFKDAHILGLGEGGFLDHKMGTCVPLRVSNMGSYRPIPENLVKSDLSLPIYIPKTYQRQSQAKTNLAYTAKK